MLSNSTFPATVLTNEISFAAPPRLAASVIGKLDPFLGCPGMRAFRKDLVRLFPCQRDVAEGLENADAMYKEPRELGRRSVPPEQLVN